MLGHDEPPVCPQLRSLLGRAYYLSGDHREAAQTMARAIEDADNQGTRTTISTSS